MNFGPPRAYNIGMTKFIYVILSVVLLSGCGASKTASGPGNDAVNLPLTHEDRIDKEFKKMQGSGGVLIVSDVLVADITQITPVTTAYGTVRQGQTLNFLTGELPFVVYGSDGVFAAECEVSALDSKFGPTHPKCQTFGTENYDRTVVCFANTDGADLFTAQRWPGSDEAFNPGLGMICFVDGVKMRSNHVFTY